MLHSKTSETIVGLFVALGLGALLVLALRVSNLNLGELGDKKGYDVLARFSNIGGLKIRSPVKLAGVTIGRVADVKLDSTTFEAVAVLSIKPEYSKIPKDTTAKIYTAGLLGEQYISMDPGGDEVFLKGGDEITLTQSAVVLEQIIGQFLYSKAAGGGEKESKSE